MTDSTQTFDGSYHLTVKDFFFKVLNGSAQGIIVAVCPSAIVKYLLMPFVESGQTWAMDLNAILVLFCSFLPIIIGVLTALQFNMRSLDVGVMAIATGASTGSFKWATAPE
ncbi:putative membrane protein [Weissella uvarum]|nr:putative membrane protein [Weissella uvarum]